MRKSVACLIATVFLASLLIGCATVVAPVTGVWYTNVDGPVTATSNANMTKTGTASCSSILGVIAVGDASQQAAMKKGGITKVHHVDFNSFSILGVYAKFTTTVYGE